MSKVQFRRLVVRAIEDAIMLLFVFACIGGVCAIMSILLRALGLE